MDQRTAKRKMEKTTGNIPTNKKNWNLPKIVLQKKLDY